MSRNENIKISSKDGAELPFDEYVIADRARQAGISDADLHRISVIADSKLRLTTRGMHWPAVLAGRRFKGHPHEGPVVSIGTKLRGRNLTSDEIDATLTHELVHASQELDPASRKISQGWALRIGAIATGAVLGYHLAGVKGATLGAVLSDRAGYTYGPHEVEARKKTKAILHKS